MQLDTFIKQSIYSVMSGLQQVDGIMQSKGIGCVWTADLNTAAKDLVNVRLVKAPDPENEKKSRPVILFDFDVNVAVEDEKGESDKAEISVGGKFLKVFNISGAIGGASNKKHGEKTVHNLKFTVPVCMKLGK